MAMFISKKRELRIIVRPADRTFDEARRPIIVRGERIEFLNHRYQTNNEDLIVWLKRHPLCGSQFICADEDKVKPAPPPIPQLIIGTQTTADKAIPGESPPEKKAAVEARPFETPITRDEIEIMMEQKFDSFLNRVTQIMQSQAQSKEPDIKPKRTFKCPECEKVFKSGVEVGKHKKLVHGSNI